MHAPRRWVFGLTTVIVLFAALPARDDVQIALNCWMPFDGINQAMATIAECIRKGGKPTGDEVDPCESDPNGDTCHACKTKPDGVACQCGKNPKGEKCAAACKKDPKNSTCKCRKDPKGDECKLAKACEKKPTGTTCQCGRDPLGPGCKAAHECEDDADPKGCFCRKMPNYEQCKSTTVVDPPGTPGPGEGPPGTEGPGGEGPGGEGPGGGGETPEGGTVGGQTGEGGEGGEGGTEGDQADREELTERANQCHQAVKTVGDQVKATSSLRTKANLCKAHTENCLRVLGEIHNADRDLFNELGLEMGKDSFKVSHAWNCFCEFSHRDNLKKLTRIQNEPLRRFEMLKKSVSDIGTCGRLWISGDLDERMAPEISKHSSFGSNPGHHLGEFHGNPIMTRPFFEACRKTTRELKDFAERSGTKGVREDYIRTAVDVAMFCDGTNLDGMWDERRVPQMGRDFYELNDLCRKHLHIQKCEEYLSVNQ